MARDNEQNKRLAADSDDPVEIGYRSLQMLRRRIDRMLLITFRKELIGNLVNAEIPKRKQEFTMRKGLSDMQEMSANG